MIHDFKKCPGCGTGVFIHVKKCGRCGFQFSILKILNEIHKEKVKEKKKEKDNEKD